MMNKLTVFVDGSCSKNGSKNAVGGIGIHFPNAELPDLNKAYRLDSSCTNQRTELYAILIALKYINSKLNLINYSVTIKSDSSYSINCITKWVPGWIKDGWLKKSGDAVMNRDLIEPIYEYYCRYDINFQHVSAHTGGTDPDSLGNERADLLATKATQRMKEEQGPVLSPSPKETRSRKVKSAVTISLIGLDDK